MKNTNLNLKIKRLPYSRLLKSEMADYVEKTIDIVDSHYVESELIDPLFEMLSAKKSDINLLRLSYGVDTERLRVNKLKGEMMLTISAFKIKTRLLSKSTPALDIHAIQNAINTHLRYLDKCRNDKELSQKIAGFFDLVDSNEEFETQLADLKLTNEVDAIRSIYATMEETMRKRVRLLAQRPEVSTKELVNGMSLAVDNLFQSIEVANMLSVAGEAPEDGEQIELAPLIDELNQLSEMYSLSISIREANNKRKANKAKNGEDGGEEEGDEDNGEPIATDMCFSGDENDESLTYEEENEDEQDEVDEMD